MESEWKPQVLGGTDPPVINIQGTRQLNKRGLAGGYAALTVEWQQTIWLSDDRPGVHVPRGWMRVNFVMAPTLVDDVGRGC